MSAYLNPPKTAAATKVEDIKKEKQVETTGESVALEEGVVFGDTPSHTSGKAVKVSKPSLGADPNKPRCRKAKEIRREKREMKKLAIAAAAAVVGGTTDDTTPTTNMDTIIDQPVGGVNAAPTTIANDITSQIDQPMEEGTTPIVVNQPVGGDNATPTTTTCKFDPIKEGTKPLEHFLNKISAHPPASSAHRLTMRLVRSHPRSPEFESTLNESYEVYRKYQMAIHGDPPNKCTLQQYMRFLMDSPLIPQTSPKEWECGYGSYHQQYFIDGKLVMVGVLDILKNCISSKYLYYDPQYGFLKLGVFSALNEIALVRRLHSYEPSLQYYCMGYYVHTCTKMNYKGSYAPSYLLCPVTNTYVPIELCKPKLDICKYAKFNEEGGDSQTPPTTEINDTLVLYQHNLMPFAVLRAFGSDKDFEEKVQEYTNLVGPKVSKRAILYLA